MPHTLQLQQSSGIGIFHMPTGSSLRDAAERLSRLSPDEFRRPQVFAFIFSESVTLGSDLLGLAIYDPNREHLIVDMHNFEVRVRRVFRDKLEEVEQSWLDVICEADLLDLMRTDGLNCVLETSGNYHFVTPALVHTDRFIRIGDMVRSRDGLDRLTYWLTQRVRGIDGLLVDTWSISSIALKSLMRADKNVPLDCLPEHPAQNIEQCSDVIQRLVAETGGSGKILVLVSISGSGTMVQRLRSLFISLGSQVSVEIISIFGFVSTPKEIDCLARIDDHGNSFAEGNCKLCHEDSITIPIDPSSYQIRSWREHLVKTGEAHFDNGRDFINTYREVSGLFFAHRNDQSDNRHHALDIDVRRLLQLNVFRTKHIEILRSFKGKVSLVVAPTHSAAKELSDLAADVLKVPILIHDTLRRNEMSEAQSTLLTSAESVLIVDDTINSGSRIHQYIQSIREGGYGEFKHIEVHVGMARPESDAELKRLSVAIGNRHPWQGSLVYTEKLILPRWGAKQCPWCKEFDLLARTEELFAMPPLWLTDRLQRLRAMSVGIEAYSLLSLTNEAELVLGAGSPICAEGTTLMPLIFAVASGLQNHRFDKNPEKQLHPDYPLANVLDSNQFKRYDEGLIRAVFLRLLNRHELGAGEGVRSWALLTDEMKKPNQGILVGELIAALGRRAFPPLTSASFRSTFASQLPDVDLRKLANAIGLPE